MHIPDSAEIREKRIELGLTQSEIAEKSGLSQSMIARIESGTVDPRVSTIKKIVDVLNHEEISIITAGDMMHCPVISVLADETLAKTVSIMENFGISQIPVIENGVAIGCISESAIINAMDEGRIQKIQSHIVEDFMEDGFPTIPKSTSMDTIIHLLHNHHAILVSEKGKVVGVITKHDLIGMITK
ncbi:CBS domain-containing protein [Methanomicrobium antiquum]|uniref:CBS domain-containing protein n=1 Tax=Methanomicrobium antiquum TaxID=487686 RepID=A0AAF0JM06_9EURY|nr:CBS domain-containing protein [Methanomicrobium antiquum]MDD3976717.1 CBS domain-containing protein [Methanomicrobium sp.]WFN35951.1 CBS domain-containing protein [Methanomicrobium antiquum]